MLAAAFIHELQELQSGFRELLKLAATWISPAPELVALMRHQNGALEAVRLASSDGRFTNRAASRSSFQRRR
jgi:hypothetical protein